MRSPDLFGQSPIEVRGDEVRYRCPFCLKKVGKPDKSGHLYLNTRKRVFNCFKCGSSGKVKGADLPVLINRNMEEAVEELKQASYLTLPSIRKGVNFPCEVFPPVEGTIAYDYLRGRGISAKDIVDRGMMYAYWGGAYRVFLPAVEDGEMIYWCARRFLGGEDGAPKYLNIRNVSKTFIYNLDNAKKYPQVLITEGVFSSLVKPYGVATLGKKLTPHQVSLLTSGSWEEYIVCLDPDAKREALALCIELITARPDAVVSMVELPDGTDPDSVTNFDAHLAARRRLSLADVVRMEVSR